MRIISQYVFQVIIGEFWEQICAGFVSGGEEFIKLCRVIARSALAW